MAKQVKADSEKPQMRGAKNGAMKQVKSFYDAIKYDRLMFTLLQENVKGLIFHWHN